MSTPTIDLEPNPIPGETSVAHEKLSESSVPPAGWRRWLRLPLLLVAAGSAGWAYAEIANSLDPPAPELPKGLPCHCDEVDEAATSAEPAGHLDEGAAVPREDESARADFSVKSI